MDTTQYIAQFPSEIRTQLEELRRTIRQAAPKATEVISYGMPAFKMRKVLVYFAAHTTHIGFYPTSSGIARFASRLAPYKWSKGAVQFPIGTPLPLDLITEMVKFRVAEDSAPVK